MKSEKHAPGRLVDWLFTGMHLPIAIVIFIIVAVTATVTTVSIINRPAPQRVTAYVTVEGMGEGKDFEDRAISIETGGESVADIFSLKYPDIYEAFGKPLVSRNEFTYFMGVRKTNSKSFHVTIDGKFDSDLKQAYVYGGQTIKISYY